MKQKNNIAGFTLVELMIAVALMVILTGSIVFVFTQAQRIYSNTNEAVKVYQQARAAMDTMERDFANVTKTMEMEFWGPDKQDPKTKLFDGHYNPQNSETNLMLSFSYNYSNPELSAYKTPASYRIIDTSACPYLFAPLIAKGEYTDNSPWGGGLVHDADAIYFKAETAIPNQGTRTALIKYGLSVDDTWKRPPILMKWVVWLDQSGANPKIQAEAPQALCYFVTDMKIEVYIRNKRKSTYSPGKFYDAEEAHDASKGKFPKVINVSTSTADKVSYKNFFSPLFIYMRQKNDKGAGTDYNMPGYSYMEKGKIVKPNAGEPYFTTENATNSNKQFLYQLGKGDKLYIGDPAVDGNRYVVPPGEYTIKDIRLENNEWRVYFREAIDTTMMDKSGENPAYVSYRAIWIPSAIRITLKIIDAKTLADKEVSRTISRVFRIIGS